MSLHIGGLAILLCARSQLLSCNGVKILAEPLEGLVARLDRFALDAHPLRSLAIPLTDDFFLFGVIIVLNEVLVEIGHADPTLAIVNMFQGIFYERNGPQFGLIVIRNERSLVKPELL